MQEYQTSANLGKMNAEDKEERLNKRRTLNAMSCTTTKQTGYQYAHHSSKEILLTTVLFVRTIRAIRITVTTPILGDASNIATRNLIFVALKT